MRRRLRPRHAAPRQRGSARPGLVEPRRGGVSALAFVPAARAEGEDPVLLHFTSGTTAKPKPVRHSHASYPVGALSTLYRLRLKPGDVPFKVSSPGWAKHAWSSLFAPWTAGATVMVINQPRLAVVAAQGVTTLRAPPTACPSIAQRT